MMGEPKAGHGRFYVDEHGRVQYDYEETPPSGLAQLLLSIIMEMQEFVHPCWAIDAGCD